MKKIKLSALCVLLFVTTKYESMAQDTSTNILELSNGSADYKASIKLMGIRSENINPIELNASMGVFIPSKLKCDSIITSFGPINGFDYILKRDGDIVGKGHASSYLWNDQSRSLFRKIKKGDSLFVLNVFISKSLNNHACETNLKKVEIDTLKIRFTSSMPPPPTHSEISLRKRVNMLPSFRKLADEYGSDLLPDGSMIYLGYYEKKASQEVRYQFKVGDVVNYDFSFFRRRSKEPIEVYDNLNQRRYSIKEWEKTMRTAD